MALLSIRARFGLTTAAILVSSFAAALPAHATSTTYRYDWDADWLRKTNGGFANDYFYDPTLFYSTLPSHARSFALHPYHRQSYYKNFRPVPPPPGYEPPPTPQDLEVCGNYTFQRPDRVPPFGYNCQK